jgi:hypothetical protein
MKWTPKKKLRAGNEIVIKFKILSRFFTLKCAEQWNEKQVPFLQEARNNILFAINNKKWKIK